MNAAELFVKRLEAEGVQYVFGIPGEENAHLAIALEEAFQADAPSVPAPPIDYRENSKLTERPGNIVCPI